MEREGKGSERLSLLIPGDARRRVRSEVGRREEIWRIRSTIGSFLTATARRVAACLYLGAMVILYSYMYGISGVKT